MTRLDPRAEAALRRAKQQILHAHSDDPNVTGVGIGIRFRRGHPTGEPVVTVMVANKQPEGPAAPSPAIAARHQARGEDASMFAAYISALFPLRSG